MNNNDQRWLLAIIISSAIGLACVLFGRISYHHECSSLHGKVIHEYGQDWCIKQPERANADILLKPH